MTDILVTSPYRPFTLPTQFKAVFNGYIYCGAVDAVDPSVSQVQVYLVNESGDKVPVAQPLRTNAGGFLVYNGQPAKFVTDSNHSLLVRDALGNQVWYAPDMARVDPDALLSVIRDTTATVFKNEYGYSAVDNMVAGRVRGVAGAVTHKAGNIYSTGGTIWKALGTNVGNEQLGDFLAINEIFAHDFGVMADGVADDTISLQAALDATHQHGGGTVILPSGNIIISMAASTHPYCCILISKNTKLIGQGMRATTITRPASERGVDGVLICNAGYDEDVNGGNYSASGNIVISDLGVTDGNVTPTRGLGDLIGFGNGDNLIVERCYFGNHDQHSVDICKSRNVIIRDCVSLNEVNATASATYQIDAGLIWGIAGPATSSYNVSIYNNKCLGTNAQFGFVHFHSGNTARNVYIHDNDIYMSTNTQGAGAIFGDADCGYSDVEIYNNAITVYCDSGYGINLPTSTTSVEIKGLRIFDNTISGRVRTGIFVSSLATNPTSYDDAFDTVTVSRNTIRMSASSPYDIRGIYANKFKTATITDNKITINQDGGSVAKCIFIYANAETALVENNDIVDTNSVPASTDRYGVFIEQKIAIENDLFCTCIVRNNTLKMFGSKYHIYVEDCGFDPNTYFKQGGVISGNTWRYNATSADIKEITPLTDGTNNVKWVDFSGRVGVQADKRVLAISSGKFFADISIASGKKQGKSANQHTGKTSIEVMFSPLSATGFGDDVESTSSVYLTSTTAAGVMVKDVRPAAGLFDVVSGVSGVSMIINDTSFQPVIRTSGFIKIRTGL